jgi:hypothetical protein
MTDTATPRLIVAADPGTHSAWAALPDSGRVTWGKLDASPRGIYDVLRRLQQEHADAAEKVLVVEDQYLFAPTVKPGDDPKAVIEATAGRFRAVAKVVRIRGWWEAVGTLLGFRTESALATQWQGALGVRSLAKKAFRGDTKKAARAIVRDRYGVDVGPDEADALLMGTWWRERRDSNESQPGLPLGESAMAVRHGRPARR